MEYCFIICIYNLGDGLYIEQQTELLRNNLQIPKIRNTNVGLKRGRVTEIDVNHLLLNLDELFKNTVYQIEVKCIPEFPKNLIR